MHAKVQSSNLNEELGTVHYVFSDKTGTLTQNVMEFKRFSAGTYSYGKSKPTVDKEDMIYKGITNVNFEDPNLENHISNHEHENYSYLQSFMEIMAVCHTIIVEEKKGKIVYNASSPDELALVNAAKYFGFTFKGRDEDSNLIVDNNGFEVKYELLNLIEFTSTRKRMTVIVRTEDGKIRVMCKGADSIIASRLKSN
jgi:phospholipid-transporting ATPase